MAAVLIVANVASCGNASDQFGADPEGSKPSSDTTRETHTLADLLRDERIFVRGQEAITREDIVNAVLRATDRRGERLIASADLRELEEIGRGIWGTEFEQAIPVDNQLVGEFLEKQREQLTRKKFEPVGGELLNGKIEIETSAWLGSYDFASQSFPFQIEYVDPVCVVASNLNSTSCLLTQVEMGGILCYVALVMPDLPLQTEFEIPETDASDLVRESRCFPCRIEGRVVGLTVDTAGPELRKRNALGRLRTPPDVKEDKQWATGAYPIAKEEILWGNWGSLGVELAPSPSWHEYETSPRHSTVKNEPLRSLQEKCIGMTKTARQYGEDERVFWSRVQLDAEHQWRLDTKGKPTKIDADGVEWVATYTPLGYMPPTKTHRPYPIQAVASSPIVLAVLVTKVSVQFPSGDLEVLQTSDQSVWSVTQK